MACQNNMLLNGYQYNYCQKVNSLNNMRSQKHINLLKKADSAQLFMHTDLTKDTVMDLYLSHYNVNAFSLFGTNPGTQVIMDSQISISLSFEVYQGGMICVVCDVQISNCTLVFVAIGKYVSGILIEAKETVTVKDTSIQYRVTSQHSSGLVNLLNSSSVVIQIQDCTLTGSNLQDSAQSGYIAASVLKPLVIRISRFAVCVDGIQRIGGLEAAATFEGTESLRCDVCGVQKMVYGLCAEALENGKLVGGIIKCEHPFQFVLDKCQCISGYLLNNSVCIDIIQVLTLIAFQSFNQNDLNQLMNRISIIEQNNYKLNDKIVNNIQLSSVQIINAQQTLIQFNNYNFSAVNIEIHRQIQLLDEQIQLNMTQINQYNIQQYNQLQQFIQENVTELDLKIFRNFSSITIQNVNELKQQIYQLVSNISCTDKIGFALIKKDSSYICQQIQCSIQGQQAINGICQCIYANSIIIDNQCTCQAPLIKAGTACTCPENSEFINGTCICIINDQTMINGICTCKTTGAFLKSGECTCGIDALNISNTCRCPDNSVLSNGVCTCCIAEQTLQTGVCKCPIGKSLINGICQSIQEIQIQVDLFTCSQTIAISSYTITHITHSIASPSSYSNGYVFDSTTIIINAFIDIQNNAFTSPSKPIFQNQNQITNLKVQISTQLTNGGQIMTRSTTSITMNYVTITSKDATQITVTTGQLNIIQPGSTNANINNLLVNLNFAQSQGNITLIGTISGTMTITAYEVLGTYQSSQAVAMVGLIVKITVTSPNTTVTINQLCFKPTVFNIGNCSSYLFGSIVSSTVTLTNIMLIIGQSTQQQILTSIGTSIGTQDLEFQFGGLVNNLDSSKITVKTLISDCYQQIGTDYVQQSGILVGFVTSSSTLTSVQFSEACLQQKLVSVPKEFQLIALICIIDGNSSFKNVNMQFTVSGAYFKQLSMIGLQSVFSKYSEMINIQSQLQIVLQSSDIGTCQTIGALFGEQNGLNCSVQNATVDMNVSAKIEVGGFIGRMISSNLSIINSFSTANISLDSNFAGGMVGQQSSANTFVSNSVVQNSLIKGSYRIAGFIGFCKSDTNINIVSSTITKTKIIGAQNYIAVLVISEAADQSLIRYTISGSKSTLTQINGVSRDCSSLKNTWTESQC
ncbi:Conserved_hypothetical protein [Hexamita inflata]|uniref:Uncharacterized protein n=1 Tax=Hexamita inflata TaxID=28002 RepID=A0AA86RKP3_9EUKA|nr:Conserved hypothetical protein [Hexamita inflata]